MHSSLNLELEINFISNFNRSIGLYLLLSNSLQKSKQGFWFGQMTEKTLSYYMVAKRGPTCSNQPSLSTISLNRSTN